MRNFWVLGYITYIYIWNSFIKCLGRNAQVDVEQKWNFFQWRKKDSGSYIKCYLSYDSGGSGEWLPLLETIIKSLQGKHYNKKYMFYLLAWQWYIYICSIWGPSKIKNITAYYPWVVVPSKLGLSVSWN